MHAATSLLLLALLATVSATSSTDAISVSSTMALSSSYGMSSSDTTTTAMSSESAASAMDSSTTSMGLSTTESSTTTDPAGMSSSTETSTSQVESSSADSTTTASSIPATSSESTISETTSTAVNPSSSSESPTTTGAASSTAPTTTPASASTSTTTAPASTTTVDASGSTVDTTTAAATATESSTSAATTTESSTSAATTTESSTSAATTTESSTSAAATTESSTSAATTTESSTSAATATESSTSAATATESSTSAATATESSTSAATATESSAATATGSSTSAATATGSSTSAATTTESSTSLSNATESSTSPSNATESSTSPSNATESSTSPSNATESSTSPSNATESSTSPSNATESSTSPSNATESSTSTANTTAGTTTASVTTTTTITTTTPDLCASENCSNAGTCSVVEGAISCACVANRTGSHCAEYTAFYGEWSAYGACSDTCGSTALKTRTRNCTDILGNDRTSECDDLGLATETTTCTGLPECVCTVHPCQDANGFHTNDPCNPTNTNHTCYEKTTQNANGDPICSKRCLCAPGYNQGTSAVADICVDIDECATTTTECHDGSNNLLASVASCHNVDGSYECICSSGYVRGAGRSCVDVDECTDNTDNCDDNTRATCTNLPGTFSCECNAGFTGDGINCVMDRFVLTDFVADASQSVEDNTMSTTNMVYLSSGGYVSSHDDVSVINSMYATKSGLVVFTKYRSGQPVKPAAMPKPSANTLSQLSTNQLNIIDENIVSVAAVYWADNVISTDGGIYTRWIPDITADSVNSSLRSAITETYADAAWAYIVTWNKMMPNIAQPNPTDMNSYQAVVVGDAAKREIKVRYLYQDKAMNWNLAVFGNLAFTFYPARIGTMFNAAGDSAVAEEYSASGIDPNTASSQDVWDSSVRLPIVKPDMYDESAQEAAVSVAGKFDYTISAQPSDFMSSSIVCETWLDAQPADWEFKNVSQHCAGTLEQVKAVLAGGFTSVSGAPSGYSCYQAVRTVSAGSNQAAPRCCYDSNDALISTQASSVAAVLGRSLVYRSDDVDIYSTYSSCCSSTKLTSGETPQYMCEEFLVRRPAGSSENFQPLSVSQLRGDPHITTLDDLTYTFNGHGEFVMISSTDGSDFVLQGRMGRVNVTGDATVFTGFTGQLAGGTTAQLSFTSDFSAVELYINGTLTNNDWTSLQTYEDVRVYNDSGPYALAFSNGVVVKVSASFEFELMTVSIIMAPALSGNIQGLMGNYNGDKEDEYSFANGTVAFGSTATEEQVYSWGLTWMTSAADSLFTYPASSNWSNYNDADFKPVFFNSNLTVMFPDDAKRTSAIALCNGGQTTDDTPEVRRECYFDYKVTDNAAAAAATADAANSLAQQQQALANFAPVIHSDNATLRVTVGQSYSSLFTINATDANGDSINFTVASGPAGLSVSNDGVISWADVAYAANDSVLIIASDGSASAAFTPQVALCNCLNGGTCTSVETTDIWYSESCECSTGWTGTFCDVDIDGCAQNPCFTTCTDVPASRVEAQGSEFICDPCPAGLDGDGERCYDVNECLQSPSPCDQNCENTAGSFICSCNSGYALGSDSRSCVNIDECLLSMDDCDSLATCTDTVGGWSCACNTGYQGAGTVGTCLNVNECSDGTGICPANSNCVDTVGSFTCPCDFGYRSNGVACEPIDECALGNLCEQTCVDAVGYYTCECYTNFVLNTTDKVSCDADSVCTTQDEINSCDNGNSRSTCAKDVAGLVLCYCPKGYALDSNKVCQDVNECTTGDNLCSSVTSTCNNTEGGYVCDCKTGFQISSDGVTCEDINECAANNGGCAGTCTNTAGSFVCSCSEGFTLASDNLACENVDECSSDLTNNCDMLNGNCTDQTKGSSYPLGYECVCNTGYELSGDGFTCNDINECNSANRGGCQQGCTNSIGSYSCYCGNGYTLNVDGSTCDNVDECASANTHNCYSNIYCTDTTGSYDCSCPSGFVLKTDGFTCESIEKCSGSLNCSHTCSVINSTEICQCPRGYGLQSDNITCADVDECTLGTHVCDSADKVQCSNTVGGYICECISSMYTQVESAKCIDVDECAAGTDNCTSNSYCVNQENGFTCQCNPGYTSSGSGCVDVNECDSPTTNQCGDNLAQCTNLDGSYSCSCNAGYEGDGITCSDINECVGDNNCDSRAERGICTNTVGSYSCSCASGYQIDTQNVCDNINECADKATYNVNCSQNCIDTDGSFKCGCQTGFQLDADGISCLPQVSCANSTVCGDGCVKIDGVDTCICNDPGYKLGTDNSSCVDIDECATNTSTCATSYGVCTNTIGSFTCNCTDMFILGLNNVCEDRNGGFSEWTAFGNCSATCGTDGTRTRTRACDSPSKEGNGDDCVGDTSETQSCNVQLCEEDLADGVTFWVPLNASTFDVVKSSFQNAVATGVDDHCTYNSTTAQQCCGSSLSSSVNVSLANLTFATADDFSLLVIDYTDRVSATLRMNFNATSNDVCSATTARRRRSLDALSQSLLLNILSDSSTLAIITDGINTALNASGFASIVSLTAPESATQVTTTTTTTTAATTVTTTTPATTTTTTATVAASEAPQALAPWVIPVAVVASLVGVAIIVVVIVLLIKRPGKVGSHDISQENQGEGQAQQNA